VILLDAYALVALLADEPAAAEVETLLRTGESAVTVVNLAEAVDVTRRVHGAPAEIVKSAIEGLLGEALTVVRQGEHHAWRAADVRARHYDRKLRPLSLADCLLIAAAGAADRIATADEPLAQAARGEGIEVLALPDSTGRRP